MALKWVAAEHKHTKTEKLQAQNALVCIATLVFTCAVTWKTNDLSALCIIAPIVLASYTTVQTMCINKNLKENLHKFPTGASCGTTNVTTEDQG